MDNLGDLLKNRGFGEPDEFAKLKAYIKRNYGVDVNVSLRDNQIVIGVASAVLATKLRYDQEALSTAVGSQRPIVIKIV